MSIGDIRYYSSIFMQRLPYFLLVTALVCVAGVAVAVLLPSVYRGTAKILVEAPQIPTDLARSTVPENAIAQLQIIQQEMLTGEALIALANQFEVYADRPRIADTDIVDDMRARTRIEPLNLALGGQDSGAIAFAISFDAADPEMAAAVANSLSTTILSKDAALRTARAADTLRFFQRDVDRLGAELKTIETRILDFKNSNLDALPDSLEFRRNQQSNFEERQAQLGREESTLKARRATLVQLFQFTGQVIDGGAQTPKGQLLEQMNSALASQRLMFAEDSPTITALRAQIASITGDLAATEAPGDLASTGLPPSELDLQLADIDDRLTAIAEERSAIAGAAAAMSVTIKATPANETTLNALQRSYQNSQSQYNTAVSRLAEASTGEQIEARLKGQHLSLIESATPPAKPFSPKRTLIAGGAALVGVGLGAAVVFLIEFLNRRVRRPLDIERALEIEPLATIPYIRSASWFRRPRLVGAFALVALMVIAAAPVLYGAVTHEDMPLSGLLSLAFAHFGTGA